MCRTREAIEKGSSSRALWRIPCRVGQWEAMGSRALHPGRFRAEDAPGHGWVGFRVGRAGLPVAAAVERAPGKPQGTAPSS